MVWVFTTLIGLLVLLGVLCVVFHLLNKIKQKDNEEDDENKDSSMREEKAIQDHSKWIFLMKRLLVNLSMAILLWCVPLSVFSLVYQFASWPFTLVEVLVPFLVLVLFCAVVVLIQIQEIPAKEDKEEWYLTEFHS